VAPPLASEPDSAKADALLAKAMMHMPLRSAAELIASALDLPKRAIYDRALALQRANESR
jgi:16S rRNA (cytidine1402-2'-O)-methyltransferase